MVLVNAEREREKESDLIADLHRSRERVTSRPVERASYRDRGSTARGMEILQRKRGTYRTRGHVNIDRPASRAVTTQANWNAKKLRGDRGDDV